jgi:acetylornithine deacetylase/succinyl-diaminopimelate desuccinylase-like protein
MTGHRLGNARATTALVLAMIATAPAAGVGQSGLDRVLARIDGERVVELTRTLVRIPSEYSEGTLANHSEIARFLVGELKSLGMEVHVVEPTPGYPIVIGRLRGADGGPVLGMMGHYNTVPLGDRARWTVDPFAAEIRDGRIYGRGASDQKGGIAALLAATRAIVESRVALRGDLLHVYIPGEGAQDHVLPHVVENTPKLIKADWYLDTDGGPDIIQVAAGHVWLKLTVTGRSAHPGGSTPWVNAALKLAKVVVAMADLDDWMSYEKHPLFTSLGGKPRVEIGTLEAGQAVNQIPDRAVALVDIRVNPKQTIDRVMAELDALLARLKKEDPELDITVDRLPGTQVVPYHHWASITPDDPLVATIRAVSQARLGRTPGFIGSRGGGRPDLWRLGAKWISWSANVGANAHAPDEWVDIEGVRQSARVYAEIVMRLLAQSGE